MTHQKAIFAYRYLVDQDISAAAKEAGVSVRKAKGWLKKDYLVERIIQVETERKISRLKINADWVLDELISLYKNRNLGNFLSKNRKDIDLSGADDEQLAALDAYQVSTTINRVGDEIINKKITTPRAIEVLKAIGNHVNIQAFKERIETGGTVVLRFDSEDANA